VRLAVVSDIHGNLTALEAVLADLEDVRADVVVCGGDIALGGPNPVEVTERVRDLGWPAVLGNTDAVLADDAAVRSKVRGYVLDAAVRTAGMLGPHLVDWLTGLPLTRQESDVLVTHSTPGDCWAVVPHDAPDESLREAYAGAGVPVVVYGHIHHAFTRRIGDLTVANSGSVSLALDRDPRATYCVVEDGRVEHRRVPYDIERVAADMARVGYPNATGYASWLRTGWID